MQIITIVHEHRGARPPFYALDSGAGDRVINIRNKNRYTNIKSGEVVNQGLIR